MCCIASFNSVIFFLSWFDGNLRILTAEFYHLLRSLWCIILLYKSDQTPFYPTRNRDEPFEEWGLRDLNYLSDLAYLVFCKNDIIWWVRFLWQPTFFYHRIFFLSNRLFELACIFSCLHICSLFPQEFLSFLLNLSTQDVERFAVSLPPIFGFYWVPRSPVPFNWLITCRSDYLEVPLLV